ncbi:MAG TPA: VacJ family lipoprotein [Opitutaceae bacterium]
MYHTHTAHPAQPRRKSLLLVAFIAFGGSLLAQEPVEAPQDDDAIESTLSRANDPLEGVNRAVFGFNRGLTKYALKPLSRGYEFVIPRPVRRGLDNAFDNVRFPVRFVGSLLQGKVRRATRETGRFVVNTVVGVGGLFKVSDRMPALATPPAEDVGQALAAWRLPSGPYLVLPVFGPSTPRDFLGRAADFALTPTHWDTLNVGNREWISSDYRGVVQAMEFISGLPAIVRAQDEMTQAALDPYVALREAYLAHRAAELSR